MFEDIIIFILMAIFILMSVFGIRSCVDNDVLTARLEERTACKCEHIENRTEYSTCAEEIKKQLKETKE